MTTLSDRLMRALTEVKPASRTRGPYPDPPTAKVLLRLKCATCREVKSRQPTVMATVYRTSVGLLLCAPRGRLRTTTGDRIEMPLAHLLDAAPSNPAAWWVSCPQHGKVPLPGWTKIVAAARHANVDHPGALWF